MNYFRKVNCYEIKIEVTTDNQALALSLFTKLKDSGHEVEILDHFVDESILVQTHDSEIKDLMSKI